jgi:DNA/RNA endonuclease G (NUC1)
MRRIAKLLLLAGLIALTPGSLAAHPQDDLNEGCRCEVQDSRVNDADRWLWLNAAGQQRAEQEHLPWGLHSSTQTPSNERLLIQWHYLLRHDGDLRTSLWASYYLLKRDITGGVVRKDCFRRDVRLNATHAGLCSDYIEPTFDQGHLAPDADMKKSRRRALQTYMMSNMAPQHCRFNRGVWLLLEGLTRAWARDKREIWVTSGAIFDRDTTPGRDADDSATRITSTNGHQRVAVASHFYKVIVARDGDRWRSISFVVPHTNDALPSGRDAQATHVTTFIRTMADIEAHASLDLHPQMDANQLTEATQADGLWAVPGSWPRNFQGGCH